MAKKFYVEGMTVEQILNINPNTLAKWNEREVSRALRTVALAANKRIRRQKEAKKKGKSLAGDAMRWLSENWGPRKQFGVTKAKNKKEMLEQIKTIRQFMGMTTSTVKGAKQVRQRREKMIYGQTREQMSKGMTVRQRQELYKKLNAQDKLIWDTYKKHQELQGRDPHMIIEGSTDVLESIGHAVYQGETDQAKLIDTALQKETERYEAEQEAYNDLFKDFDFWEL